MNGPVVVPLDGSSFAEVAVPMGRLLAELAGDALHLVHVVASPLPEAFHPEQQIALDERLHSRSSSYLEARAAAERTGGMLRVLTAQTDGSESVAGQLARYAREHGASWIVLTTHGAGGLSRWVRGSVAEGLTRMAATPLLFLRPWDDTSDLQPGQKRFGRILVALDGSDESETALELARPLARAFGASLSLMRVVPPTYTGPRIRSALLPAGHAPVHDAEAERYLGDLVEDLTRERIGAEAWTVGGGNVAGAILSEAFEREADLIVMATHGRGAVDRLVLGSVADEVLRRGTLPLALVRPQMRAKARDADNEEVVCAP